MKFWRDFMRDCGLAAWPLVIIWVLAAGLLMAGQGMIAGWVALFGTGVVGFGSLTYFLVQIKAHWSGLTWLEWIMEVITFRSRMP